MILWGDYNTAINVNLDRSKSTHFLGLSRQLLQFKQDLRMVNIWREQNPGVRDYTHHSYRHRIYSCIDMLVYHKRLLQRFLFLGL